MTELENLIDMLDDRLERCRRNPQDSTDHFYTRVLLTLAHEVESIKQVMPKIEKQGFAKGVAKYHDSLEKSEEL